MNEHEQRLIASISKSMAVMCVRNTTLEDIHAGIEPVSHTGDFSDVVVIHANGRRIPWPKVSQMGTSAANGIPSRKILDSDGRNHDIRTSTTKVTCEPVRLAFRCGDNEEPLRSRGCNIKLTCFLGFI